MTKKVTKKNVYAMFDMDHSVEVDGFWSEYGDFRVKIARMGGKNTEYTKTLMNLGKKYQAAGKTNIPDDKLVEIGNEIIADGIIKGWEVRDDETGEWVPDKMYAYPSGDIVDYSREEVLNIMNNLEELRKDIEDKSNAKRNYLKAYQEDIVKN